MIVPKTLIAGSQLTTSAATYYTAGTGVTAIIKSMTLTNNSGGAVTATVHIVDTGSTESASNMVIDAKNLADGETYLCPEAINQSISPTGTIRALASANTSISIKASGVEVT